MIRHELHTGPFNFEAGGRLDSIPVVYHTSGNRSGKVIWICHALTANSDPEDWWPEMVGPGKLLDTEKYFIVCVNMLGSSYGSAGPATPNPADGKPYFFDFPAVTIRDMIQATDLVRTHLGIEKIDLLIGSSIGGFQALEWAVSEPERIEKAIFIATSARISPWLGATVEAQRMALEADPTFRAAQNLEGGSEGLKCARAQAIISYRCFDGFQLTQYEQDEDCLFAGRVASYERYQGAKLLRRGFDAYSYYYLCNALDSHNIGRGRGGVAKALGRIQARSTVVNILTDTIFPLQDMDVWAPWIPGADYHHIPSNFGHDGFLLETAALSSIIEPLLCK